MKDELDAIGQHQVIGDFVELPEGRKSLPSHWVYKIKRDGSGNLQQYKPRLVWGGNHQTESIDYQATYAPTARMGHARLAVVIAAKYHHEIHHMDLCTAFLGVDLDEAIYMHPLQGYFHLVPGSRYYNPMSKTSWEMVLRLRKSLYGLKQSSHLWYGTFNDFVGSIVFVASRVDGGLFVLHDQGALVAAVVLYVDHLLIIANQDWIGQIKDQMKTRFRMHDLGSVSFHRGMNTEHNRDLHTIDVDQHSYIRTILPKFRMDESTLLATPMAMKLHKRKPEEECCFLNIYQAMIGSLMYPMTATQPDIAYAIGVLSPYTDDPTNEHMIIPKRVFRYCNGTKDWGLRFGGALGGSLRRALGGTLEGEAALGCYVDSDCAGCPDDNKSTSRLVITFRGAVDRRSS